MLHNVINYADAHGIKGDEEFTSKRIRFIIQFSPKGDFLGIHDYEENGEMFSMVPHLQFAGDVPTRQFLVDTLEFLTLYSVQKDNSYDDALDNFKYSAQILLLKLETEADYKEIQNCYNTMLAMLKHREFLELRENKQKEEFRKLLHKRSRPQRIPEVKDFTKNQGALDAVFSNSEFKKISKHQFCLRLLEEASNVEPILGVIAKSLRSEENLEEINSKLSAVSPKAKRINNISFAVVDGEETRILVEESFWHDWWKEKHSDLRKKDKDVVVPFRRCFLSGELTKPLLIHPKIKGLGGVSGNAETSLISFDKGSDAFQSYGFSQGENAAVSVSSAVKYTTTLNLLLNHQHQRHQRLAGSEIVYWYSHDVTPNDDIFKNTINGWSDIEDEENETENITQKEAESNINAKKFLRSVISGERQDLKDAQYYALTMVGNRGRAVVQNWMEGQFSDLAKNIEQWFSDLEIPRLTGKVPVKFPKIETLIACLLKERKPKQKYTEWIKPVSGFREALWKAAIGGRNVPIPENAVRQALQRYRESMLTDEFAHALDPEGELMGIRRARLYARIGLIKAYLIRNINQEVYMDDKQKNENSICQLGRLFAVLADLQRSAHKSDGDSNVKATIVDRFYTHASTCPKLVHGRLISLSQHHLRKLENKRPKAASAIRNEIAAISKEIDFSEVPDLLALSDQSWFALGYYKQIAEMNYRKMEAFLKRDKIKSDSNKGGNDE